MSPTRVSLQQALDINERRQLGHACGTCRHLLKQSESWEMSHVFWYECSARPANENLPGFPLFDACKHQERATEPDDPPR